MANYFISYDLNGQTPTHREFDEHLEKLGKCVYRVLETVWYVHTSQTRDQVYAHANSILSPNDRLLVIVASDCTWRNLLVPSEHIQKCWNA